MRMNPAARALYLLLSLIGRLPLRALHALGAGVAHLMVRLGRREGRITRRNLELCLPQLAPDAREALARASIAESGRALLETCRFWTRDAASNLRLVREVENESLFDAALAAGRGTIVAAPHLGNWELLNQYLASRTSIAIVYRPPRQRWLEDLLRHARGHEGVEQIRAEAAGVRQLLRRLHAGGTVGILPDQQPKAGDGEFAGFFGVPALTMTLLPRLVQRTGASVVFAWAERLPRSAGFRIRFRAAPAGLEDPDPIRAAAALNLGVEQCVRATPAQYQWGYKRFSLRPPGAEPRY